jgi:hypothetical protein
MRIPALLFLGAALLTGCRKEDVVLVSCLPDNQAALQTFQDFLRRNGAPEQTFSFALNRTQTLTTAAGASIEIPANAFVLPTGAVATGQAELRLRELYTVPDMLLADMPTGSLPNNTYLASGGEFKLQVWQGSTRLRLAGAALANSSNAVTLISPLRAGQDSLRTSGMTTWGLALPAATWTNTTLPVTTTFNAANGAFFHSTLPLDTLSWWNIDQLWNNNPILPRTTASFTFDTDGAVSTFTRTWLKPRDENALFPTYLTSSQASSTIPNTMSLLDVPVGSPLTAIVLQVRADGLYYGTQTALTQAGQTPHVALAKLTEAEILQRIRLL